MLLQQLSIQQLNQADDSYRVSFSPHITELKQSIEKVGLIQPLIVRHTQDGTYQVICGFKRLLALQEIGNEKVACLVYEANELTPEKALLMSIHDNAGRLLSIVEKSIVLNKVSQFTGLQEHEAVDNILPLLGEMPSYKIYHQLVSLMQLTEAMKKYAIESNISLSAAGRISEFTPATQQALLTVLSQLKTSSAKLNELLTLIREISARDGMSVEEILNRYRLLEMVADETTSSSEKVEALRQALRGIRLPQLTERQQRLTRMISDLELPEQAKLHADPYFENEKMKLEYQFSHPEELDELIKRVQSAFKQQRWHQIFDWYRS